jgi:uncharacterized protein DUF3551
MPMAKFLATSHFVCGAHYQNTDRNKERREEKMKHLLKWAAAPATALAAMAFVAIATPAAAANQVDYCRTDVTSGMRGCGYASLEQCQAMSSGRGGDCYPNPFPTSTSSNAFAYQPKHLRSGKPAAHQ